MKQKRKVFFDELNEILDGSVLGTFLDIMLTNKTRSFQKTSTEMLTLHK